MRMKKLIAIAGIALAILLSAAPVSAAPIDYSHYAYSGRTVFVSSPADSSVMTWLQATITLPSQSPTWSADGQETSGWLLANRTTPDPLGNWNQVGWVSYGPDSPPYLYEETSVNGVDTPQAFGPSLQWGDTINVALSCDTSTGIWQDWGSHNATSGLTLLSTQWTLVPCDTARWSADSEWFSNGASTFPATGPQSITNLFADVMGNEYRPSDIDVSTMGE